MEEGMKENKYIISDAAKMVEVEPHVLRYWEVELGLNIMRNELGHRYYTDNDINMLRKVKKMKEEGVQLKRIKREIENPEGKAISGNIVDFQGHFNEGESAVEKGTWDSVNNKEKKSVESEREDKKQLPDKAVVTEVATELKPGEKLEQFKIIMGSLISEALRENMGNFSGQVSSDVSNNVLKEMDYLFRESNEREEERYRRLDETIRNVQKCRQEIAASEMRKEEAGRKKRWFSKKKKVKA